MVVSPGHQGLQSALACSSPRLATEVTVIDTHNMHRYRCPGPGDRLTLTTLGKSWMVGTLAPKVR